MQISVICGRLGSESTLIFGQVTGKNDKVAIANNQLLTTNKDRFVNQSWIITDQPIEPKPPPSGEHNPLFDLVHSVTDQKGLEEQKLTTS